MTAADAITARTAMNTRKCWHIGYIAAVDYRDGQEWGLNGGDLCSYSPDRKGYGSEVHETKEKAIAAGKAFKAAFSHPSFQAVYVRPYWLESPTEQPFPLMQESQFEEREYV